MIVLFIEDDRMNRRVVRDMLDVAGVEMTDAEDGEQGLELIEAHDYDVTLVDLRMPGMSGLDVIAAVRARSDAKARMPLIVVTADAARPIREQCLAAGADDVLFKPVSMEALFDAIGRVLADRQGGGGVIG